MKKISLSDAPRVPFDLEGYIVHSSSGLEVIHLCLQPGQWIAQHSNPFDVVVCVIEGEATLHLGNSNTLLVKYDVVEVEKHVERGFTNSGTTETRLLILKKL